MKLCIIAAACLAVVSCASISLEDLEFHAWKLKFGKVYESPEEEAYRKDIWLSSRRMVLAHNILADQGIHTYHMGMNHLSDMSDEEYRLSLHSMVPRDFLNWTVGGASIHRWEGTELPASVDWRTEGCVTPVRFQGYCGSCWAFSSAGAIESHTCIKFKRLPILSVQQLLDCSSSPTYGNKGCKYGYAAKTFIYVMKSPGLVMEKAYPYKGKVTRCKYDGEIPNDIIGARVSDFVNVTSEDEDALKNAVATQGPVSIAMDHSHISFKAYQSGVYYEPQCSTHDSTHLMLVVGYGTENGQDYWLVKNSWGTAWGEKGYIKMARNRNNNCGTATYAFYPIVKKGGMMPKRNDDISFTYM
ncbi:procathepsin L-like [Engraulis encrasicolus]|uniref:procathepsin L-like n=1 Tax=Engraulis encrasicolus TaxID=184585 RepID=UPI002FD6AD10